MKAIEDFSKVFDPQEPNKSLISPEFDALVDMAHGIHARNGISSSSIPHLLIGILIDFDEICATENLKQSGQVAQRLGDLLKTGIESLPHLYTLRIEFPRMPKMEKFKFPITERISLVCDEHNFEERDLDPPLRVKEIGLGLPSLRIPIMRCFLEISFSGYVGSSSDIQESDLINASAKQVAYWLVRGNAFFEGNTSERAKATLERHHRDDVAGVRLPDSIAKCFGNVGLDVNKLEIIEHNGGTLLGGMSSRQAASPEEKNQALETSIELAVKFFRCKDQKDFQGVAAAIEWYQDSLYMENQTLSLIAACIGLEAIMGGGDNHMEQMSSRLADRYAYMLGNSKEDRDILAEEYKRVLKRRGTLVHARTGQLSEDDQSILYLAQEMLRRVIDHEARGMRRRLEMESQHKK